MKNSLSNEGRKQDNADMLVIGISSQALFGLRESHELFDAKGLEALHKIQSAYPITDNPIRIALVTAHSASAFTHRQRKSVWVCKLRLTPFQLHLESS